MSGCVFSRRTKSLSILKEASETRETSDYRTVVERSMVCDMGICKPGAGELEFQFRHALPCHVADSGHKANGASLTGGAL